MPRLKTLYCESGHELEPIMRPAFCKLVCEVCKFTQIVALKNKQQEHETNDYGPCVPTAVFIYMNTPSYEDGLALVRKHDPQACTPKSPGVRSEKIQGIMTELGLSQIFVPKHKRPTFSALKEKALASKRRMLVYVEKDHENHMTYINGKGEEYGTMDSTGSKVLLYWV